MPTRPRLVSSIPFWGLVVISLAVAGVGAFLVNGTLGTMTTTLTDGSATGVDVYVGQSVALFGSVLVAAGIGGILLALAVAALSTLRPKAPVEVVEPIDWTAETAEPVGAEPLVETVPTDAVASEPVAASTEDDAPAPVAGR
ncbi:dinucleotide-utilizing enzyme [Microbacterium sp. BWT-B31]|uniref:dinucleotide-utilizing enzyme n=1 Tax=Microbacterium sp. BWT-B31 TaxID=3232072 RepID=UPI003527BBFB